MDHQSNISKRDNPSMSTPLTTGQPNDVTAEPHNIITTPEENNTLQTLTESADAVPGVALGSIERLRARLDRAAESKSTAWRAEPGDELVGHFVRWDQATTRRDETHAIAIVRALDGESFAVWCFYAVLREELEKAKPQPGELLVIRRLPDRVTGDGVEYRVYAVAVDREANDPATPFSGCAPPHDAKPPQSDWSLASSPPPSNDDNDGMPF